VQRGDAFRIRLPKGDGQAQHTDRYAVVVQADALLPRSVILMAPTSRSARPASFRPEALIEGQGTRVLVEQVGAVDVSRLGALVGHLTHNEMWDVDEALTTVLGFT
jgi:mRNA interferase MazF